MRIVHVNADSGIRPGRPKGAAVHVTAIRSALRELGHDVVHVDDDDPAVVRAQLELGQTERPFDLVYERYALGAADAARFASTHRIPFVLEVNAPLLDEERWFRAGNPDEGMRAAEREIMRTADLVLAVSPQVADYVARNEVEPDRIRVRPNGVDAARFTPALRANSPATEHFAPHEVVLGFHGRLRPWHAFEYLVEVTASLVRRGLPVRLCTVGQGDFAAAIEGQLPEDTWFGRSWCDHDDVGRWVARFDVLPFTYDPQRPFYFSPLKLAEAMASGVVPVVPDLGDLADQVVHGETGLVYPAGDWQALEREVERLVTNAILRTQLGRAARSAATARSWSAIAHEVVDFARGTR